ncbi:MAG: hypothetical protein PHU69_12730 [Fermentimonas sp.]|nr:hypothetical protein [Fermentimonas sp.]
MQQLEEQFQALKETCTNAQVFEESGYTYIYIPDQKMPPGCKPPVSDVILCPQEHSGYTSRLFFKDIIQTPKQLNWNGQAFILGQQWHAFSFNNVANMPLLNMVINHLRGLVA